MQRICFYHAGCPDGFGAAWAVRRAWGPDARFEARGHDAPLDLATCARKEIAFVDIAPPSSDWRELAARAAHMIVLDHHVTSQRRFESDPELRAFIIERGHVVHFDTKHSGAVLAWEHFLPQQAVPALLHYVEDQDLWRWRLPNSAEINAAIAAYPRSFDVWDALAERAVDELAGEGAPLVRAQHTQVERALLSAHPITVAGLRVEAVNARFPRAAIGHALAQRARFEKPWGAVYRLTGDRVDVTLYSIGEFDIAAVATRYGGGGHRNAAGFSVSLERWLAEFILSHGR